MVIVLKLVDAYITIRNIEYELNIIVLTIVKYFSVEGYIFMNLVFSILLILSYVYIEKVKNTIPRYLVAAYSILIYFILFILGIVVLNNIRYLF